MVTKPWRFSLKKVILALFIALASVCVVAQEDVKAGKTMTKVYESVEVVVNNLSGRIQGDQFIVEGYIYPAGTTDGSNGINADGTPEFPDQLLGLWTCNGWFATLRDESITPVSARTWQTFEFDLVNVGNNMISTHGFEQLQLSSVMTRPVSAASGVFADKGGVQTQSIIGINPTGGPNYLSTFSVTYDAPFKNQ